MLRRHMALDFNIFQRKFLEIQAIPIMQRRLTSTLAEDICANPNKDGLYFEFVSATITLQELQNPFGVNAKKLYGRIVKHIC